MPGSASARAAGIHSFALRCLSSALRHGPLQPLGPDSLRSQGHCAHQVAQLHQQLPQLSGVIQEGTGYGSLSAVASALRRRGVRTVLVPANIESLAPNTGSWTHRGLDPPPPPPPPPRGPTVCPRRRSGGRCASMRSSRSRSKKPWWLQLHGIQAGVLPYFPAPRHHHELESIRMDRSPNPAFGLLWLAEISATLPTRLECMSWLPLCIRQALPPAIRFGIAVGRGSEHLRNRLPPWLSASSFAFRGEVSDGELKDLQEPMYGSGSCIPHLRQAHPCGGFGPCRHSQSWATPWHSRLTSTFQDNWNSATAPPLAPLSPRC